MKKSLRFALMLSAAMCCAMPVLSQTGTLTLISPNGGELFEPGGGQLIEWSTTGVTGDTVVELSVDGGSNWIVLAETPENITALTWFILPNDTTEGRIRVSSKLEPSINDSSDNFFTILQPSLVLTSSNGGQVYTPGDGVLISWTGDQFVGGVIIELSRDAGATWEVIANDASNDGSETWIAKGQGSSTCLIRIKSTRLPDALIDVGNTPFEISQSTLVLTSPNGGQTFTPGSGMALNWTGLNFIGGVIIELSRDNGLSWEQLIYDASNDGNESWIVQGPGTYEGLIRIKSTRLPNDILDQSDTSFTISQPVLTLNGFNSSQTFTPGDGMSLSWTGTNFVGGVSFDLSRDNGTTWEAIINNATNDGSETWIIKGQGTTEGLIRIKSTQLPNNIYDQSDTPFTISQSSLTLNVPNGGETLTPGASLNFLWSGINFVGGVILELSRDNGLSWETLNNSLTNDGNETWRVSGQGTTMGLMRIKSMKLPSTILDQSDTPFTILQSNLTVTAPTAAVVSPIGTTLGIDWVASSFTGNVKVELSRDNGGTWEVLAADISKVGPFNWVVSGPGSNQAQVKVTSIRLPYLTSTSQNFTIGVPNPGAVSGLGSACAGSTQTYSVSGILGETYQWSIPSGTSNILDNGSSISFTWGSTGGSVAVTASNTFGSTIATPLEVTVTPSLIVGPITGPIAACSGSTETYSTPELPGATYTWSAPADASIVAGPNNLPWEVSVVFGAQSGSIGLSVTNTCGVVSSSDAPLEVTVTASLVVGAITGPITTCSGSTETYSTPELPGATYSWSAPADASIVAGPNNLPWEVSVIFGTQNGNIGLSVTNPCGTVSWPNLAVTVTATPVIAGGEHASINSSSTYTSQQVGGASWAVAGDLEIGTSTHAGDFTVDWGAIPGDAEISYGNNCLGLLAVTVHGCEASVLALKALANDLNDFAGTLVESQFSDAAGKATFDNQIAALYSDVFNEIYPVRTRIAALQASGRCVANGGHCGNQGWVLCDAVAQTTVCQYLADMWELNVTATCVIPLAPLWQPATGDLDGNGLTDVLWCHRDTNEIKAWLAMGTGFYEVANLQSLPQGSWRILGMLDGNSEWPEALWYNAAENRYLTWSMADGVHSEFQKDDWAVNGWPIGLLDRDGDGIKELMFRSEANEYSSCVLDGNEQTSKLAVAADDFGLNADPLFQTAGRTHALGKSTWWYLGKLDLDDDGVQNVVFYDWVRNLFAEGRFQDGAWLLGEVGIQFDTDPTSESTTKELMISPEERLILSPAKSLNLIVKP